MKARKLKAIVEIMFYIGLLIICLYGVWADRPEHVLTTIFFLLITPNLMNRIDKLRMKIYLSK